jgi:hypothetical protein
MSNGPTESTGFGWFVVALAGTAGIAIGIALGFALSRSGGGSIAELTTQRDRLAAENTALAAERDRLRVANATLTTEKNRTEHLPEKGRPGVAASKTTVDAPAVEPESSRIDGMQGFAAIPRRYGPNSAFYRFAESLGKAGQLGHLPGATIGLLDAGAQGILPMRSGNTVIWTLPDLASDPKFQEGPEVTLIFSMLSTWVDPNIVVMESRAISEALGLDKRNCARLEKIVHLIPDWPANHFSEALVPFSKRLPEWARERFSKLIAMLPRPGDDSANLSIQYPAVGFDLGENYAVHLIFGVPHLEIESHMNWSENLAHDAERCKTGRLGISWSLVFLDRGESGTLTSIESDPGKGTIADPWIWPCLTAAEVDSLPNP